MTRILAALVLTIAVGCTNVQPAGPFADRMGRSSPRQAGKGTGRPASASDRPGRQANAALNIIYPDEVSPENFQTSIQKLKNELETDRKNIPAALADGRSLAAYKGGVKQE